MNSILKQIKKEKVYKNHITFSIDYDLINSFKKECKKRKISQSIVIEKLIQNFLTELK